MDEEEDEGDEKAVHELKWMYLRVNLSMNKLIESQVNLNIYFNEAR